MKPIVLSHREWDKIFALVKADYADSPATYLISSRMRRDLGWTYREHRDWYKYANKEDYRDYTNDWRDSSSRIHIDFYTEEARTMFLLRYMGREA